MNNYSIEEWSFNHEIPAFADINQIKKVSYRIFKFRSSGGGL